MTERVSTLQSATDIDLVIRAAIWAGQGAIATTIMLACAVLLLRWRFTAAQKARLRLSSEWRPVLAESVLHDDAPGPARLPRLRRADYEAFLHEWLTIHDTLKGAAAERLNEIAQSLRLDRLARGMLEKRNMRKRLLATATLGHLREAEVWPQIASQLDSDNTLLSLVSAGALVKIDRRRAASLIIPRIVSREDWPVGRVASLLQEIGVHLLNEHLVPTILEAPLEKRGNLLALLAVLSAVDAEAVIHDLLERTSDVPTITACLNAVQGPNELPRVRELLKSPEWPIRLQAVKALGRIGTRQDTALIVESLSDREWWVRYRAAQSLALLPWVDVSELSRIQSEQTDPYAGDILEQVIAELSFA